MTRVDEIRERTAAATPGPWRWRGHDDGSIELRARINGGQRIVTTMRSEPCIVEVGKDVYGSSLELTPTACKACRARFERADFSDGPRCEKLDNLNTVWLADPVAGFVRPANHWARREVPYRADVVEVEHADARFIEHARDDVPYLVAQVDALEEALWTLYDELTGEKREPRDDIASTLIREPQFHGALNKAAGVLESIGRLERERARLPDAALSAVGGTDG